MQPSVWKSDPTAVRLLVGAAVVLAGTLLPGTSKASAQARPADQQAFVAVESPIALTNVRIINGTGAPAQDGQTIVIQGDRITAVGATGDVDIPSGPDCDGTAGVERRVLSHGVSASPHGDVGATDQEGS